MRNKPPVGVIFAAGVLAAVLAACGSSGRSGRSGTTGTTTPRRSTADIASRLVLGGAPTCPTDPSCQIGLAKTYGLHFKSFKPLDTGGPLTAASLEKDSIQVGLLFTTSAVIAANGWVLLKDDKSLQRADNVTPVLNGEIAAAYGKPLADLVNQVSAKITTHVLSDLNKQTDIDQKDPDAVARSWLRSNGLIPTAPPAAKTGPKIIVGSSDFTEDETLADIYADVLEADGYPVSKQLNVGSRETYVPALQRGQISFIPDYAGSLLTFLDPKKSATTNPDTNATRLAAALAPLKLTALDSAPAQDVNGFVVTKATADRYDLAALSDLAKPAP